ncbi:hypothetical protein LEP1GSC005_1341 [Leptospira santarosai str. ST188]|nr:hypothetical protein LEP1GSC005_1341 [Leptospira santarosai str. ST188]
MTKILIAPVRSSGEAFIISKGCKNTVSFMETVYQNKWNRILIN